MAIDKSGLYYPNIIPRIYLTAVEEIIGAEAIAAALKLAGLPQLIDRYPPQNFGREFDFSDFGAIGLALETMYGPRGERGLGMHASKACFQDGVQQFGSIAGVGELVMKTISNRTKVKTGLKAMAEAFTKFSDQMTTVEETDDYFLYIIHRCPVCWGRTSQKPICYVAAGIIQTGLQWLSDGHLFEVEEVACCATGNETCVFQIGKDPAP